MVYLEEQHNFMMQQNKQLFTGVNISLELQEIIIENQALIGSIADNIHFIMLANFMSIIAVVISLLVLTHQIEKLNTFHEENSEAKDGAYVSMDA